ncbi:hypothetical protein CPB84DRAFT_1773848 [Gymnopilus junonius]|uniref:DUF6534 domain-containing protein n=1 Tax=Gymnopilus junonius TaxID=109634 RepID=A0A9P5NR72_GYMJU|nr:hypothetical protein CPB84DRAFT_1773848 [Gymnopilus junonius]
MVSRIQPGTFLLEANSNLGAVEIMTFLSLILLGISLSLGYTFFRRSEGEPFSMKLLVRLFHSFTASQTVYYETITRWNRGEANSYPLRLLNILCLSFGLLRFIGGIALSVESILDVPRNPNGVFVFTFPADVLIASFMVYYLRQMTSPLNLKSTTAALNRLVRWTLQTGLVTRLVCHTRVLGGSSQEASAV